MKKLFHGSCHCGAARFEASIDLDQGIRKCNCSFCWKTGYRKSFATDDAVEITAGRDVMIDYLPTPLHWPEGHIHHYMCPRCGVHVVSRGFLEKEMGGWFWAVNVSCLDDVTEEEMAAAPSIYEDGKHDRQLDAPKVTAYL